MKMTEVSERTEAALRISASSLVRPDRARAKVRRLEFATEKSVAKLTSISWQSSQRQINADLEHLENRAIACAHLSYFLILQPERRFMARFGGKRVTEIRARSCR